MHMKISKKIIISLLIIGALGATIYFLSASLSAKVINIVIYGDSRSDPITHQKIVEQILKYNPIAVFHVGDLVDNPDSDSEWAIVNKVIKPLQDKAVFLVAAGNHEKEDKKYYDNFVLPGNEKWYSWETNKAHFIVLNTNLDLATSSEQYKWVENDLASVIGNKYIIVVTHHPYLSVSNHAQEKNNFNSDLNNLFIKYKISAVFSGHEHNYERFLENNINYLTCGSSGAPLYDKLSDSPYLQKFSKSYNFCVLSFKDNNLSIDVFNEKGEELDKLIIK